jgi:hypothetical protein
MTNLCISCGVSLADDVPRVIYHANHNSVGPFCSTCAATLDAANQIAAMARWETRSSAHALGRLTFDHGEQ